MNAIDACLSERNGHLFVEDVDTVDLVKRFGSPLFVFSEDQIRRNVGRFREAFEKGWDCGPVKVMPAVKANWTQAVQRVLAEEGCGADVYSAGELEIALRAGMKPAEISVNGVPKAPDHIARTVEVGARLTIDSLRDVEILEQLAPSLNTETRVAIRLRPAVTQFHRRSDFVPEGPVPTDLVALAYKGGLSFDEAVEAGRRVLALPSVKLVGFHQHHGRHHPSTAYWEAQMRAYGQEIGRVCRALDGYVPQEIDIGGGFAMPRDPHNAATDYLAPYQFGLLYALSWSLRPLGSSLRYRLLKPLLSLASQKPNTKAAPSIEDYAAVATHVLRTSLEHEGIDPQGITLQLEPGRSIHGNAGVHLTSVCATKTMDDPLPFAHVVVDTSEFWLAGGRLEHHLHEYQWANKMNATPTRHADISGRSCYADRLLGRVPVPDVEVGDVLALLDTGAYQEVSASNFNAMARPAAVLVRGSDAHVIRRAETFDDVVARDELPPHLMPASSSDSRREAS